MPTVFLTSASTSPWSQPGDWVDAGHTVRLIGAGGRGGTATAGTTYRGGPGGGGGAHVLLTRTSGSLASTTDFHVGIDNSSTTDRTTEATCWASASFTNCYYVETGEGGGVGGTDFNGGLGGDATTTSTGSPSGATYSASLNNSGGAGGTLVSPTVSGGGGGGAGGPAGVGGAGGNTTTVGRGGGGGGAGDGGGSAAATSGVNGTAGAGAGGGAGGTSSTAAGNATGTAGSGGGGGFFSAVASANTVGGAGGVDALDTQTSDSATAGPGGGGGGGGSNSNTTAGATTSGGAGGNYGSGGGGAGGARNTTSTRTPGAGASGLIVVTYTVGGVETITVDKSDLVLTGQTVNVSDIEVIPVGGAAGKVVTAFTPAGDRNDFAGDVGFGFRVTNDLIINQIGLRCATGNTGSHTVNLSDQSDSSRLATATVDLTGGTVGTFYYVDITPVTLVAGQYYAVTAEVALGGQLWSETGATTVISGVTNVYSCYQDSSTGPIIPIGAYPNQQYVGLDLNFIAGTTVVLFGKPVATPADITAESITVNQANVSLVGKTVGIVDLEAVTQATVTLAGQTVTIPADTTAESITVTKADIVLTGQTVTPVEISTETITVTPASVTLTGQTVGTLDLEVTPVTNATVTLAGQTVTIPADTSAELIQVTKADITCLGQTVGISESEVEPVTSASLTVTGQTVDISDISAGPIEDAWNRDDAVNVTLTNGDKTGTGTGTGGVRSTTGHPNGTGKYYAEFLVGSVNFQIGIKAEAATGGAVSTTTETARVATVNGNILRGGSTIGNVGGACVNGDVICIAWDAGAERFWARRNSDPWNNDVSADPASGTNGLDVSILSDGVNFHLWCLSVNTNVYTLRTRLADLTLTVPSGFASWMDESLGDTVTVNGGSVTLTGQTVGTIDSEVIPVAQATVVLTGQTVATPADLVGTELVPVGKGDILLTGGNVTVTTTGEIPPVTGGGGGAAAFLGRPRKWWTLERARKRLEKLRKEREEAEREAAELKSRERELKQAAPSVSRETIPVELIKIEALLVIAIRKADAAEKRYREALAIQQAMMLFEEDEEEAIMALLND